MLSFIKKIFNFAKKSASLKVFLMFVLVFGVFFFAAPEAFAQSTSATSNNSTQKLSEIISSVMLAMYVLFFPIISVVGALMESDFVMGGPMAEVLRNIWIFMRDLTNIVFVFVLLFIAFVNVLGSGAGKYAEEYEIKKILPKVVVALVLVNFTFFFSRVAIDAVNVLTTAIYAIPMDERFDLQGDKPTNIYTVAASHCDLSVLGSGKAQKVRTLKVALNGTKEVVGETAASSGNVDSNYQSYTGTAGEEIFTEANKTALKNDGIMCYFILKEVTLGQKLNGSFVAHDIPFTIAASFTSIVDINKMPTGSNEYLTFFINNFFQLFLFVAIFFAFLALMVALVARVVMLWFYVIFSPFLVLKSLVLSFEGPSELSIDEYFKYLLIPVKVAIPMTIGFIMMTAIPQFYISDSGLQDLSKKITMENVTGNIDSLMKSSTQASPSVLQQVLYVVMTIGILYSGVFMAFENTRVSAYTDAIKGAGKWVMKSPQYMPLPIPGGSVSGFKGGLSMLKSNFNMGVSEKGAQFGNDLSKMLGIKTRDTQHISKLNNIISSGKAANKSSVDILLDVKNTMKSDRDFAKAMTQMSNGELEGYIKDMGITDSSTIDKLVGKQGDAAAWRSFGEAAGLGAGGASELETAVQNALNSSASGAAAAGNAATTNAGVNPNQTLANLDGSINSAMTNAENLKKAETSFAGLSSADQAKAVADVKYDAGRGKLKEDLNARVDQNSGTLATEDEVNRLAAAVELLAKEGDKSGTAKATVANEIKDALDDKANTTNAQQQKLIVNILAKTAEKSGIDSTAAVNDATGGSLGALSALKDENWTQGKSQAQVQAAVESLAKMIADKKVGI